MWPPDGRRPHSLQRQGGAVALLGAGLWGWSVVDPEVYEQHNHPGKVMDGAANEGVLELRGHLAAVMSIADSAPC